MIEPPTIVEKPYPPPPPACEPWRLRGPAITIQVIALIQERLPGTRIEHIGSSAVPGCAGKNFVDLLIPYDDAAHLRAIDDALFGLGFGRQRSRDPFPEVRPLRIGAVDWEGERVPLHVHVVPAQSPEIAALIGFRDRLRTDPALLEAYVRNKRAILAAGIVDGVSYAEAKGSFIRAALGGTSARRRDASGLDESGVPSRGHFNAEPPAPASPDAPASNARGRHDARGPT